MLKLYTDIELLTEENRSHVFPLLFDLHYLKTKKLLEIFEITNSLNDSDIIVLPLEFNYMRKVFKTKLDSFRDVILKLDKKTWVYTGGDFGYSYNSPNVYTFRFGGLKSELNNSIIVLPCFVNDPYDKYIEKEFEIHPKIKKPKIGFVGHAKGGFNKYLKEIVSYLSINLKRVFGLVKVDYQPFYPSSIIRSKYLKTLESQSCFDTNFIYRDFYRAGAKTENEKLKTTKEFYNNIFNNCYTFCIRGAGNFSVRLYETLAVGRIPILIDTDCLLPLSNQIDWSKHCIILKEEEFSKVKDHILNFHNSADDIKFEEVQNSNRSLWENHLTRQGFFTAIHLMFSNKN